MTAVHLGLKENAAQFSLLVLINAFVGGMVGLERSILPSLAEQVYGLNANLAVLSFIAVFGLFKAATNYLTGALAQRFGRKNLLVVGWIIALPIPFLLMYAPNWNWILFANALLGIQQGLTWSSTVVMKIELVGPKQRGLAMGINESAGYLALGGMAFLSGWVATEFGLVPYPFFLGIAMSIMGLLLSVFFVRDTRAFAQAEAEQSRIPILPRIAAQTTYKHPNLASISQAGLVNNLNDGMIWGLLPVLLLQKGFSLNQMALLAAIYPAVWGLGQLFTGALADVISKKKLLFWGMLVQGISIPLLLLFDSFQGLAWTLVVLGLGTAVVYPTFLAGISENTHPSQRPKAIGTFRLWRDLGYVVGALLSGWLADRWSIPVAMVCVGALTLASGFWLGLRMKNNPVSS